jgi:hypothetical protein
VTHRTLVAAAAALSALAVLVPAATAKEGVVARILTPVSRAAEPGSTANVVWTLTVVEDGKRRPFGGGYVFVRLFGPNGSRSPLAYGVHTGRPARYRATVRVPRGGVTRLAVGIMGSVCGPSRTNCRPAPRYFRIAGRALR